MHYKMKGGKGGGDMQIKILNDNSAFISGSESERKLVISEEEDEPSKPLVLV